MLNVAIYISEMSSSFLKFNSRRINFKVHKGSYLIISVIYWQHELCVAFVDQYIRVRWVEVNRDADLTKLWNKNLSNKVIWKWNGDQSRVVTSLPHRCLFKGSSVLYQWLQIRECIVTCIYTKCSRNNNWSNDREKVPPRSHPNLRFCNFTENAKWIIIFKQGRETDVYFSFFLDQISWKRPHS